MCKITIENDLTKIAAGVCQSVFLVEESLHNDAGFIPVLLCAAFPQQVLFLIKRRAVFVCVTEGGGGGYLKLSVLPQLEISIDMGACVHLS